MITLTLLGPETKIAVTTNRIVTIEPCPTPEKGCVIHLGSHRIIVQEQMDRVLELMRVE